MLAHLPIPVARGGHRLYTDCAAVPTIFPQELSFFYTGDPLSFMKVLLGVGNELSGDDGIGPWVAQHFHAAGWQAIDCFTVPENYTSKVKRLQPTVIVIVDAADMAIRPGEMRRIPLEKIEAASFSTHMLPLSMVVGYLAEATSADIGIIGIQPEQFDGEMSSAVRCAGEKLLGLLASGEWITIDPFCPGSE